MVRAVPSSPRIETDTWVQATWQQYASLADHPAYEPGRCYYDNGWMRIEMAALGPLHARENSILSNVISLFATLKDIRIVELTNPTLRKSGMRDGQPDIAFYIGSTFQLPPRESEPLDVDRYGVPQLVVEIASTTLSDDLGRKRLLYERFGVCEYWVVDVTSGSAIAFEVADGRSGEIQSSQVLPGLELITVEEALKRGQTEDDGAINRWLIGLFSQ
ncbi:MAG: Uma2 family endonuclease [Thainema sp.]